MGTQVMLLAAGLSVAASLQSKQLFTRLCKRFTGKCWILANGNQNVWNLPVDLLTLLLILLLLHQNWCVIMLHAACCMMMLVMMVFPDHSD